MRNMLLPLLLALWMLGCEQFVRRPPIETRRLLAEAVMMEANANVAQAWALCMEARSTQKLGKQELSVSESCGPAPASPVTIAISHRTGDVPQFSLVPPLGAIPVIGGVLGATQ